MTYISAFFRGHGAETLRAPLRIRSIPSARGRFGRILHDVVAFQTLHIILIRVVIDNRVFAAEIIPRWRRRNTPLQRGSVPRVFRSRRSEERRVGKEGKYKSE